MRLRRPLLLAALALAAAVPLAGCGGDDVALDPVAEAAATTADASSYRVLFEAATTGEHAFTMTGTGEVSTEPPAARVLLRTAGQGEAAQIGEVETVVLGTTLYLRMPFLRELAPQLKPWVEIDLERAGEDAGIDIGALLEVSRQTDPSQTLDFLRSAGEVEEVGKERVGGVETTHYRATVDLDAYVRKLRADGEEAAAGAAAKALAATGQKSLPLDVWVDADSLVRRLAFEQRIPGGGALDMTMELKDFGADVDVEAPPADQTTTFEELMELQQG